MQNPDRDLGIGWQRSGDRAVTADGDATGFHVLVADASSAYAWRTAATLAEPGTETDQWVGQLCVTGSGRRAVVVYGPRQITNSEGRFGSAALAAVVDLSTGAVAKLPQMVSIAYHDPGCGAGETAVLSRQADTKIGMVTQLLTVDAARGGVTGTVTTAGQITSAVPYAGGITGARGGALVGIDGAGAAHDLVRTAGVPFRIVVDRDGGLGYQVQSGTSLQVHRFAAGKDTVIGTGGLADVQVKGQGGTVFVTGPHAGAFSGRLPGSWKAIDTDAAAEVSTQGQLAVISSSNKNEAAGRAQQSQPPGDFAAPVTITAQATATKRKLTFTVPPAAMRPGDGLRTSPALGTAPANAPGATALARKDASTDTTDPDRTCGPPRNDPHVQVLQPSPQQVEWAANLAVQGKLTLTRPANWHQAGLPAYSPQKLFPPKSSGPRIPAQILLGVLAQESNMWQASNHTIDGETGNIEQGGFYGNNGNVHVVNWAKSDCGYGMAQITDGMCRTKCIKADGTTDTPMPATQQMAVTIDYAANAAKAIQILQSKWNQLSGLGLTVNGGDPRYLENWWFALWAYNSGYHAKGSDSTGMYGLGWTNNPLNSNYDPQRSMFLHRTYDDAKTPQKWSYPERVMGFAASSLVRYNFVNQTYGKTFAVGRWPGDSTIPGSNAPLAEPPFKTFCDLAKNQCNPTKVPACQRSDFKCWWHYPVSWVNCSSYCGQEHLIYTGSSAEPSAPLPDAYKSSCTSNLPRGTIIVDDVPNSAPPALGCPGKNWTSRGSLTFKFAAKGSVYPSKIDFHQIGAGWGGHFWFAHTHCVATCPGSIDADQIVTGTWSPGKALNAWTRVMVHIPNHGAHTQQAHYKIYLGGTLIGQRSIPTRIEKSRWVNLGVFDFRSRSAVPKVVLSNDTPDGQGTDDIAWDAAAFTPLAAKPKHFIVAMGDSYSSGEGAGNYDPQSDNNYGNIGWDACRRSQNAWIRKTVPPGGTTPLGNLAGSFDPNLDLAFVACSGARADELADSNPSYWRNAFSPAYYGYEGAEGHFREAAQLDSGFLDDNTTLVTLTIGGNDAGFADTITSCVKGSCPSESTLTKNIDNVQAGISSLISAIHSRAKNAKIVLMGYPMLFGASGACVMAPGFWIGTSDQAMLNRAGTHMRDQQLATVQALQKQGVPVSLGDTLNMLGGIHALCGSVRSDDEWINRSVTPQKGPGDFSLTGAGNPACQPICVSRESVHPKYAGTTAYAAALQHQLSAIGYRW